MNSERVTLNPTENLTPSLLERPLSMSLQAGAIMRSIQQLNEKNDDIQVYMMNDGMYTTDYVQHKRWRSVSIERTAINATETDPESGDEIIHGGNETAVHIQQRNDGATRIILEAEMFDLNGTSYVNESAYEFKPYDPLFHHEEYGSVFNYRYEKPTSQELIFVDIKELLDSIEYTIAAFAGVVPGATTRQNPSDDQDTSIDTRYEIIQNPYSE